MAGASPDQVVEAVAVIGWKGGGGGGVVVLNACRVQMGTDHALEQGRDGTMCRVFAVQAALLFARAMPPVTDHPCVCDAKQAQIQVQQYLVCHIIG